jgi:hypothetical protein
LISVIILADAVKLNRQLRGEKIAFVMCWLREKWGDRGLDMRIWLENEEDILGEDDLAVWLRPR